jgi:hypothetical protein
LPPDLIQELEAVTREATSLREAVEEILALLTAPS